MTTRTINTCDVCKVDCPGVYHVDLGNDYTTPREMGQPKTRVMLDFCGGCYGALLDWIHSKQQKAQEGKATV